MKATTASVFYLKDKSGKTLPILVADDDAGQPQIIPEVLAFSRALSASRRPCAKVIRAWLTSLALFNDHLRLVQRNSSVPDDGNANIHMAESIAWFLHDRLSGVETADGALRWEPVKFEAAERDRTALRTFSEFCAEQYGHIKSTVDSPFSRFRSSAVTDRLKSKQIQNLVLGHLTARKNDPNAGRTGTPSLTRRAAKRHSNLKNADVRAIISCATDRLHRMAFILGAFGGMRLSEILQLWICDVVPPGSPKNTDSIPLVILADPVNSRHVDLLETRNETRLQRLATYGMTPRPLLPPNDPYHAGWKGIAYSDNNLLTSRVYWTDHSWADDFQALFDEQLNALLQLPENLRSPFLLVSTDLDKRNYGRPMKVANLRSAFKRACEKADVDFKKVGGMHALRHFYNETLKRVGMSPQEICELMRHRSLASQEHYGRDSSAAGAKLDRFLTQGGAK